MNQNQRDSFERFVKKEGGRSEKILSNLGKKKSFVDALNTEIGQELLKDILRIAENKLDKIINDNATEMDKAGFKVCKFLAEKWVNRVNSFYQLENKVFNQR